MNKIPKVLFLSRGNGSRAQMAEGFLRALAGNQFIPVSVGTEAAGLSPPAIEVMSEAGIDISTQEPRDVASVFGQTFPYVVVLCDEPREGRPLYPFTPNLIRWSVSDPEIVTGGPEARRQSFRQVRDQIRGMVEEFTETMNQPANAFAKAHAIAASAA